MSRAPMHPMLKLLIGAVVLIALYTGIKFLIAYVRFYDIKSKMEEAALNSFTEGDSIIAVKLAETALSDKLPIAGDYFFQVKDDQGKVFVLEPESDQQQQDYLRQAARYFVGNMKHGANRDFSIAIAYDQEIYFPFNIYKHVLKFRHEEIQQQAK
jgi:hypothetical protein